MSTDAAGPGSAFGVDERVPTDADPPVRVEVHPGREAVVEFDPTLTFECVDGCTWCCHHGVLLYDRDLLELARRANLEETTVEFRGERWVPREDADHDHTAEDGAACHFLTDDGLCSLQVADDWKPTRCSVFPLGVSLEAGDLRVEVRESAREHCEGLDVSERRVVDELDAFLPAVLWDLPDPDTEREV